MGPQDTKKAPSKESAFVPEAGIEPARYCYHWILNPARLPIPPLGPVFQKTDCKNMHLFCLYKRKQKNCRFTRQFFYLCRPFIKS